MTQAGGCFLTVNLMPLSNSFISKPTSSTTVLVLLFALVLLHCSCGPADVGWLLDLLNGVFEANHGLCAMISWALVLPDLMTSLMAMPSLMIGLPFLLAALMDVILLEEVSLNALACLMAVLVTVTFLKVVLLGW